MLSSPHDDDGSRDAQWTIGHLMHLNDTDDAPKSVTISLAADSATLLVSGHVPAEGSDGASAMVELVELPPENPGVDLPSLELGVNVASRRDAHNAQPFSPRSTRRALLGLLHSERMPRGDVFSSIGSDASTAEAARRPTLSLRVQGWQAHAASQGARSREVSPPRSTSAARPQHARNTPAARPPAAHSQLVRPTELCHRHATVSCHATRPRHATGGRFIRYVRYTKRWSLFVRFIRYVRHTRRSSSSMAGNRA